MTNAQIQALVDDMLHPNPVGTAPADSRSARAYGVVMSSSDPALLQAARESVVVEKDKQRRRLLYLIISKVGTKLPDLTTGPFLSRQLEKETDKFVLMYMLEGIAELPLPSDTDLTPILGCLADRRWQVRYSAIQALKHTVLPLAEDAVIRILQTSDDPFDLAYANETLSRIGTPRAIPAIEPHLQSRKRDVKASARFAIEEILKRAAS